MRVAYLVPSLQKPSGWRSHAIAFLKHMHAFVTPVIFVARRDLRDARQLFSGLEVQSLPEIQQATFGTLGGWRKLALVRWSIYKEQFPAVDLVHSLEAYPTGLVGDWLARRLGVPHVLTSHGTYGVVWHQYPFDRRVYHGVLQRADAVCPVSHGTARLMRKYFASALVDTPLQPILNGSDAAGRYPREAALKHQFPSVPTLLTVGDVKPRKGQHLSLAAFALVKSQLPEARYWIVGAYKQDTYTQLMQHYIKQNHLKDVFFLGTVSDADLHRYYQGATVFVLTPQEQGLHFEGFGLVYLEAGAYGLPVIGTRSGGVADAVRDGVTGLLVDPGDSAGLAQAMLHLLQDQELARQMGRRNRDWAETLTWQQNAQAYYQVYQAL